MARVLQNQATFTPIRNQAVSQLSRTVREAVAEDLKNDVSPNRELAEQLYVAQTWPLLADRANCKDELSWAELLDMPASEADELEADERKEAGGGGVMGATNQPGLIDEKPQAAGQCPTANDFLARELSSTAHLLNHAWNAREIVRTSCLRCGAVLYDAATEVKL